MDKEKDQTMVRIPSELIQRVRILANREKRTVPRQVEYLLRKALEEENV